jgi:hypothetical protein
MPAAKPPLLGDPGGGGLEPGEIGDPGAPGFVFDEPHDDDAIARTTRAISPTKDHAEKIRKPMDHLSLTTRVDVKGSLWGFSIRNGPWRPFCAMKAIP